MSVKPRKRLKSRFKGMIYIAPWIFGFLTLQLYPLLSSLYYSFTDFNILGTPTFIGIRNFQDIFSIDPTFWVSVRVTFIFVLIVVPGRIIVGLIIALLLNSPMRMMNFYRTAYYLPSILGGSVAVAILWRFLFMQHGVINAILGNFGISPIGFLSNPDIALFTLSGLQLWQFGAPMVLFLAAIRQVPVELYEAARIDGSGAVNRFFKITLPYITPIILFNVIMQMNNAFQEFTTAFVVTGGGPMNATLLYALKLYNEAFAFFRMGYASALSWLMFLVIFTVTIILFKTSRHWVYYEDGR